MARYIELPLETDPDTFVQDAFDYIQSVFPDWQPNDANLEVVVLAVVAQMAAEARDVASDVPASIFQYFGETIMQVARTEPSRATVNSTWTMIDNAGYTIEAGTLVGIPRTGDELVAFEVVSDVVVAPGSTATAADGVTLVALEPGADANNLTGAVQLIDTLDYVVNVVLAAAGTGGGADGETTDEYLDRLTEEMQLLSPRPVRALEFATLARRIAGVDRATAIDNYNAFNNLLTANQSSVETDTTGFQAATNVNISRTTAQASHGAAALQMSSIAAGDMIARTLSGVSGVPVTPGQLYTARAEFRSAVTARQTRVGIVWFTAAGAQISEAAGTLAADSTAAWGERTASGVAPATAAFASVYAYVIGTGGAAEIHYVDKWQLREGGTSTTWVIGPAPAANNEKMVTVVAVDEDGVAASGAAKTAIKADLEAKREWNFVVNVTDPTYTALDYVYTVRALPNYDTAVVKADIDAALADFSSPAIWGRLRDVESVDENRDWTNRDTVRYLEVAEVINRVAGVDYIESLTVEGGTVDVKLPGVAPLPTFGSSAGTVNAAA